MTQHSSVTARPTDSLTIVAVEGLRSDSIDVSFDYSPSLEAIEIFLRAAARRNELNDAETAAAGEAIRRLFGKKRVVLS